MCDAIASVLSLLFQKKKVSASSFIASKIEKKKKKEKKAFEMKLNIRLCKRLVSVKSLIRKLSHKNARKNK
jgi:hypothetical protein